MDGHVERVITNNVETAGVIIQQKGKRDNWPPRADRRAHIIGRPGNLLVGIDPREIVKDEVLGQAIAVSGKNREYEKADSLMDRKKRTAAARAHCCSCPARL